MVSKIELYEEESQEFKPFKHFISRIQVMRKESTYGAEVASKWTNILNHTLVDETYPVIHPIGQETFSLYRVHDWGI